jgi:hypothetical protein
VFFEPNLISTLAVLLILTQITVDVIVTNLEIVDINANLKEALVANRSISIASALY